MESGTSISFEERTLAQAGMEDMPAGHERIDGMRHFGGTLKRYGARPDLVVSGFDLMLGGGAESSSRSGACMVVVVLLDGDGESRFAFVGGQAGEAILRYESGMTYVFFSPRPVRGTYRAARPHRFRGAEIRVGLEVLDRLGALDGLRGVAAAPHPLRLAGQGDAWICGFPTPPRLRTLAEQLLEPGSNGIGDLVVEARGLDILSAAIAVIREPPSRRGARMLRNARPLEEARAILLADLARPWKVREIARKVGLTEKRLKSDFRAHFDEPVYGFLQRARLEHARGLLETGTSVTEAATAVGYANPSHFAKLFRRQFGVRPSDFLGSPRG